MKGLVVTTKSNNEYVFLTGLLKKLGFALKQMSAEELEDFGLLVMMEEADRSKKLSKETIMRKLRNPVDAVACDFRKSNLYSTSF